VVRTKQFQHDTLIVRISGISQHIGPIRITIRNVTVLQLGYLPVKHQFLHCLLVWLLHNLRLQFQSPVRTKHNKTYNYVVHTAFTMQKPTQNTA